MATDKRLDQVSTLTDFDYALIVKGDQVAKASKQQLAELVGDLLYGATNASSLASVVEGILQVKTLINYGSIGNDANYLTTTGDYLVSNVTANIPIEKWGTIKVSGNGLDLSQMFISINGGETFIRSKANGTEFCSWQRIDNFGYNSLAEFSAGVASEMRLSIAPSSGVRAKYATDFDANSFPSNHGFNVRFDDGRTNGIGFELFLTYSGGFYYKTEGSSTWKKVSTV